MKKFLVLALIVVVASLASAADPTITFAKNGNIYTITATADAGATPAIFASGNLVFSAETGTTFGILSNQSLGNTKTAADFLGEADTASYYFDATQSYLPPESNSFTASSITLNNIGGKPGTESISFDMLQIYADGDFSWSGGLAFDGQMYSVSGSTVPEPATMTLLAVGAVALIRRRK